MREFSVNEIADKFGVSKDVALRWCKEGRFPNAYQLKDIKIGTGHPWRIPESDIKGFVPPKPGRPQHAEPTQEALRKRELRKGKKGL